MLFVTIAFAVVAVVALVAAIGLHILCQRPIRALLAESLACAASQRSLEDRLRAFEKRLNETSSATLAAEVADLRAAAEADRASIQKRFGKVWGTLGAQSADQARPASNGAYPPLPGWQ